MLPPTPTPTPTDQHDDPHSIFLEILSAPTPFVSPEQEETCRKLCQELDDQEVEQVARVSYAYWYVATNHAHDHAHDCHSKYKDKNKNKNNSAIPIISKENRREHMALKEIRRHLVGEGESYDNALLSIRKALAYRTEYNMELLRSCFGDHSINKQQQANNNDDENENENEGSATKLLLLQLRSLVEDDLQKQKLVVRGFHQQGGAVAYKFGRTTPTRETNELAYITANLYMAERAMAATEYASRGQQEKLVVAFDFNGYVSANAPPTSTMKTFAQLLQRVYPERLLTLVILEPPFWMRAAYALLYSFLSNDTVQKVQMATGMDVTDTIFSELVDEDQAMPMIRTNGQLASPVDMERFLDKVPFHLPCNDNAY